MTGIGIEVELEIGIDRSWVTGVEIENDDRNYDW